MDKELQPRAHSYWRLARLAPGNESFPQRLLSRNEVTGCALACNRALLDSALPIPQQAIMHDWWLALHAGFRGRLVSLPQTLVDYRQHASNVVGANSYYSGLSPLQNWAATWHRGNTEVLETVRQARAFRHSIAGQASLEPGLSEILDCYCELPYLNRTQRLSALRRCSVWRHNPLLDAVLVLRTLLLPGSNH